MAEGIRDLEVNVRLHFPDGWSVMPDLVIRHARIAIQYDGDHHRLDRAQYESDIDRDAMLRERGWTVIKVTGTVFTPGGRARFLGACGANCCSRLLPEARRSPPALLFGKGRCPCRSFGRGWMRIFGPRTDILLWRNAVGGIHVIAP